MSQYDPQFLARCPAFAQLAQPLRQHLAGLSRWPQVADYAGFASLVEGCDANLVPAFEEQVPAAVKAVGGYEPFVAQHRSVPTRAGNWHDLFNALVWLHYPRFKWAINALQLAEMHSPEVDVRNKRTIVQSRAAQFDEGGMILLTDNPAWLAPLERYGWREFFVEQRALFGHSVHCLIVGHALYESLLQPFVGITAKALPLVWSTDDYQMHMARERGRIDAHLATQLAATMRSNAFLPLPLLGVPGWYPEQNEAFYANPRYFRPGRAASPGDGAQGQGFPEG